MPASVLPEVMERWGGGQDPAAQSQVPAPTPVEGVYAALDREEALAGVRAAAYFVMEGGVQGGF